MKGRLIEKIHGYVLLFIVGDVQGMHNSRDFKLLGFLNLTLGTFRHMVMYITTNRND